MKAQIATLVLSESGWMPFKIHVHDDVRDRWIQDGRDPRDELRNSIARHLKRRFGERAPSFFFVLEDRTTDGGETRPHAHGSIGVTSAPLPLRGKGSRSLRKLAIEQGETKAMLEAGRQLIRSALKAAAGHGPRISLKTGVDQVRNVWTRARPYHPIFNYQHVSYAFRNTQRVSKTLGDRRFAMTNDLRAEARRLWNLIKNGDVALDQWRL